MLPAARQRTLAPPEPEIAAAAEEQEQHDDDEDSGHVFLEQHIMARDPGLARWLPGCHPRILPRP